MRFTSWSYSRLTLWEQCPLRAKLRHLDKLPEPSSPQMDRGSMIHQLAQDYTEHKCETIADELKPFVRQFDLLRRVQAKCEGQWGFTATWKPCDWFARGIWLRVKCDAVYLQDDGVLVIVDHKTGRIYDDHRDQLELYAVAGFVRYPVERIRAEDWYIDQDAATQEEFSRDELPELQQRWECRVKPYFNDMIFAARPGPHCRYCTFSKAAGGPCKF
jgi:hypothetical protein